MKSLAIPLMPQFHMIEARDGRKKVYNMINALKTLSAVPCSDISMTSRELTGRAIFSLKEVLRRQLLFSIPIHRPFLAYSLPVVLQHRELWAEHDRKKWGSWVDSRESQMWSQ